MIELAGKMCHLTYEQWYTIWKTISHKTKNTIYQVSKISIKLSKIGIYFADEALEAQGIVQEHTAS